MTAAINGDGNLEVVGDTSTRNVINVQASNPATVFAAVNGTSFGPFNLSAPGKRVVVRGGSDRDLIQVIGHLPCEIYGNGGDDRLYGSEAGSVIFATGGHPLLVGGGGVNVLVGGYGVSINQSQGGGIILAGATTFTYDQLRALADAFVTDPTGTDLSALVASFTPHTASGQAQLSGGGIRPTAFLCKSGDAVTGYDPSRGDQLFTV